MIGIDRYSGRSISGNAQLASRIREVFSIRLGTEAKRRGIGTDLLDRLGDNLDTINIAQTQNHLLSRLSDPVNGLNDIAVNQVAISSDNSTVLITVRGVYLANNSPFEVIL